MCTTRLDRVGLSLSGLCAVHCLLLPLLLAALPLTAAHALHDWMHPALVLVAAPVGATALRSGLRVHGSRGIAAWIGVGLVLVLGALPWHFWLGLHGEGALTLTGSLCLAVGHGLNWMNSRRSTHRLAVR